MYFLSYASFFSSIALSGRAPTAPTVDFISSLAQLLFILTFPCILCYYRDSELYFTYDTDSVKLSVLYIWSACTDTA